jgi:ABC-type glycerol-3-phosphate transport system substrate-binding protein
MEEMARKYREANNITVEVVLQESDNLVSAFRTAEGAGEAPDLAFLWGEPWHWKMPGWATWSR